MFSFRLVWKRLIERLRAIIKCLLRSGHAPVHCAQRSCIGARNPYAVYRAIHKNDPFTKIVIEDGKKVKKPVDPHIARELLNNLSTGGGSGLPYEKLFDPFYGSCLYCKRTIVEARAIRTDDPVIVSKEYKSLNKNEDTSSRQDPVTYPVSPYQLDGMPNFADCVGNLHHWDPQNRPPPYVDETSICAPWIDLANGTGYPDDIYPSFVDPVQNAIPDCYLLASLSSIAWYFGNYAGGNRTGAIITNPNVPINFLDPDGVTLWSVSGITVKSTGTPVNTDYRLPKTASGEFAGSKTKSHTTSWVPYYEKAFAKYLEKIGQVTPSLDPDKPEICSIPCGDPGETLRALMQKPAALLYRYIMNPDIPGCSPNNVSAVWNFLHSNVAESRPLSPGNKSRKTCVPAIARTYPTGDPARGVVFDELIVAAHSYSLLGIVQDSNNNTTSNKYIILRNPYGNDIFGCDYGQQFDAAGAPKYNLLGNVGTDPLPAKGAKAIDYQLLFPSIKVSNVPYKPYLWIKKTTVTGNTVVMPNDGMFALHINDFVKYFSEFAFVSPT